MAATDPLPLIVYVDDEPLNLRVFEANFRARFRILTFSEGARALEALAERAHEVAVLVTDQRMPGMSGVELLEHARTVAPEVRRMLITAYSDMQAVMDAVNRGQVVRYFVKPWVREEVGAALEDAVGIWTLQRRVAEVELQMHRSQRLAALGQISAGIAHELMNPVSYLSQNVSGLRQDVEALRAWMVARRRGDEDPEIFSMLDELPSILADVETGSRHIRQVALTIRSQARGEETDEQAGLVEVVEYATRIARVQLRERARIQYQGEPVRVAMGPVRLGQVMLNLVINAVQALDLVDSAGLVEVRWRVVGGEVQVEVADNGPGMSPEVQRRAFEPLFTTKPPGEGTGLGLSICRDLVEKAGGSLDLHSVPGEGTRVTLSLPLADPVA